MSRDTHIPIQTITRTASEALTAAKFVTAAGALSAADSIPAGVTLEDVADTEYFTLGTDGAFTVTANAVIAENADVAVDAGGTVKTAATGNPIVGVALEAATASGDNILIKLQYKGDAA